MSNENKKLSAKQLKKVSKNYGVDVTDVRGYARIENGKTLDFIIHFEDGSMTWLDASRGLGLCLEKISPASA